MKTPEEIKTGLECCTIGDGCKECPYNHNGCGDNEEMADALAYIQQLEARVLKWISVEEKLPEPKVPVLTLGRRGGIGIGYITRYSGHVDGHIYFYPRYGDSQPTHWMPLPELPKEDTK